jgi:hypothetical protein
MNRVSPKLLMTNGTSSAAMSWEIATDATLPRIVSRAPSRHRKPTAPGSNANLLDSVRQKAVIWN